MGVSVGVGVMVGVSVGRDVSVGSGVMLGVGVLVGNKVNDILPGPVNASTSTTMPMMTKRIAATPMMNGTSCCRFLRYESIVDLIGGFALMILSHPLTIQARRVSIICALFDILPELCGLSESTM